MRMTRIAIGLFWLLALAAGRGVWSAAGSVELCDANEHAFSATASDSASAGDASAGDARLRLVQQQPRVDIHGNEIEDALADYRLDVGGGIYERHAPDTALPKLAPPGT